MQVRLGWTGEIEPNRWSKVDITVDEGDLTRLLDQAEVAADVQARLPTKIVFQLLQNEAETLLLGKLVQEGYPADKAKERRSKLDDQSQFLLTRLRGK